MKRKLVIVVIFLLGIACGQMDRNLSYYGCTDIQQTYNGNTYSTKVCIVYDPNMNKHFIVSTSTSGGTSIIEE